MTPYTLADAETDLAAALHTGNPGDIDRCFRLVDHHEALERKPLPSLHASALWYATQGLRVFPLAPGTKKPRKGSNGLHDATTNPDIIDGWWEHDPESNVGIATGNVVDVIDIDGPTGVASYLSLIDDLPPIVGKVLTPRPGGMHLFVAAVPGRGNKAGILPGLDYRGAGGYVVAAPSVVTHAPHPGSYRWLLPLSVSDVRMAGAA